MLLPVELQENILSWLDRNELCVALSVCQLYNSIVTRLFVQKRAKFFQKGNTQYADLVIYTKMGACCIHLCVIVCVVSDICVAFCCRVCCLCFIFIYFYLLKW